MRVHGRGSRPVGSSQLIVGVLLVASPARAAQGPGSDPWPLTADCIDGASTPTFGSSGHVGGMGSWSVRAVLAHDDGAGLALWAGGQFTSAGGVPARSLARWIGGCWVPHHVSSVGGTVEAMAQHDDGSGPALYVAGSFVSVDGISASRIARWNGVTWTPLGSGTNGTVRALAVYDGGGGTELVAAGDFTSAGGLAANGIARWNGVTWTPLGSGTNGTVRTLLVHDDGSGPALFAAGDFTSAGGMAASRIARWDGIAWTPLGSGLDASVRALAAHDDGSGLVLFAGGDFTSAGGAAATRLARWDGAAWMPAGSSVSGSIQALLEYDDGNGPKLYATLEPLTGFVRVLRWNGSELATLGSGNSQAGPQVLTLALYDDGSGPELVAAGSFSSIGGQSLTPDVARIARFDGTSWSLFPGTGLDGTVYSIARYDEGSGPVLFVAGFLHSGGDESVSKVAAWEGSSWAPRNGIVLDNAIYAMQVHDDGSGPALFAGRHKWNGSNWSLVGGLSGPSGEVRALLEHDDGNGLALFAGGDFSTSGPAIARGIARWDGMAWSPLGSGMPLGTVCALAEFDDGGGPALYAAGSFTTAGDVAAPFIARWDGASWSALAGGAPNSTVLALRVHDDGSGPALYAGGLFTVAGGVPASRVARWDGSVWSALRFGTNGPVHALATYDDGTGPTLVAGGEFTSVDLGASALRLARWNGSIWRSMTGGTSGTVHALLGSGSGPTSELLAGGGFLAFTSRDANVARWTPCPDTCPPVLSCPASVFALDRTTDGPGEIVTYAVTADDDRDPFPTLVCTPPSGSFFPRGTTVVQCTATDSLGNQSTCAFPVSVWPKARPR